MNEQCCGSTRSALRRAVVGAVIALLVAAVFEQLRRPPEQRTWRGRLFGFVPYSFRMPTMTEVRDTFWNPANPNVLTGRLFGLGWTFNLYSIWRLIRSAIRSSIGER
jgi:hypothetical protein